jgi:hypothetical protein
MSRLNHTCSLRLAATITWLKEGRRKVANASLITVPLTKSSQPNTSPTLPVEVTGMFR